MASSTKISTPGALQTGLIESVRRMWNRGGSLEARVARIGQVLGLFLGAEDLLRPDQCEVDPDRYRQHILHVEEDGSFSIVALAWLPGQETSIHDHVCWCALGIHEGTEREEHYELSSEGADAVLVPGESRLYWVGDVATLMPPGDVHRVVNPGPGRAISIHVYGTDVRIAGTSIRNRYDLPIAHPIPEGLPASIPDALA